MTFDRKKCDEISRKLEQDAADGMSPAVRSLARSCGYTDEWCEEQRSLAWEVSDAFKSALAEVDRLSVESESIAQQWCSEMNELRERVLNDALDVFDREEDATEAALTYAAAEDEVTRLRVELVAARRTVRDLMNGGRQ
jgi:2-succinyl-5-enolpyruvyl-6-hydroxy-3-cyclohexene-1-carboxylate synthase